MFPDELVLRNYYDYFLSVVVNSSILMNKSVDCSWTCQPFEKVNLDITLDEKLNWGSHINILQNAVSLYQFLVTSISI